jgi:amidohydrolase
MTEELRREAEGMAGQLVRWRREFHRHPELGFEERWTSGVVRAFLEECGIEVASCAGTGLRGVLKGAEKGRTVALRADMDALPITEDGDKEYRSRVPGVMHACGHDGHMAILMGAAKILARRRASLRGSVVFLFQPSEENPPGGAKRMIDEGALDRVDRVFGLHLWQSLPTGIIGARAGALMAQPDNFQVVVKGKGGHAALPHFTVDPVLVASHVVVAAQSIASRFLDPLKPVVVSFTMVHGGTSHNIIPDSVTLTGTVRTLDADVERAAKHRLRDVCEQTCRLFGASAEFTYEEGYPPVVNDAGMVDLVARVARREFGGESYATMDPVMGGEDFAYFLERVPGAFVMLGMGDNQPYPHHNARFDIDERALPIGVQLMAAAALEMMAAD